MQMIRRAKVIEGTRIPCIARNLSYYFSNLEIFEDGMFSCSELMDLEGLRERIDQNRIITQIPEGESISIFHLGLYKVLSAKWLHTKDSYFKYAETVLRQLNPTMSNIYRITQREKDLMEQRKICYAAKSEDFYEKKGFGYPTEVGDACNVFLKYNGINYLISIVVYRDGIMSCYNSKFTLNFKMEEAERLFDEGTLFTSLDQPTNVILDNYAELTLVNTKNTVNPTEKCNELKVMHEKMGGRMAALERCRRLYYDYLEVPDDITKKYLKEAYEALPDYMRLYLGGMDNKDHDYKRIIYTNKKREV